MPPKRWPRSCRAYGGFPPRTFTKAREGETLTDDSGTGSETDYNPVCDGSDPACSQLSFLGRTHPMWITSTVAA